MRKKETKKRPTFLLVLEAAPFSEWLAVVSTRAGKRLFYISLGDEGRPHTAEARH